MYGHAVRRVVRIHLNCAVDRRGHLAGPGGKPVRLSDETDLRRVHALRAAHDAILVGSGTVLADDPSLAVKPRYASGSDPLRVVLDRRHRVPASARVLRDDHAWVLDAATVEDAVAAMEARGLRSCLVEGGNQVWQAFWRAGAWDEATVYVADTELPEGPLLEGFAHGALHGRPGDARRQGAGTLLRWLNPR